MKKNHKIIVRLVLLLVTLLGIYVVYFPKYSPPLVAVIWFPLGLIAKKIINAEAVMLGVSFLQFFILSEIIFRLKQTTSTKIVIAISLYVALIIGAYVCILLT